jgi:hypothetical protein
MIIDGLKKRLYDENNKKGGKWIHELPHVVWRLRTQLSKAIGQTPFFLGKVDTRIGLYLPCWTGSHEELFRLRLESLHSG